MRQRSFTRKLGTWLQCSIAPLILCLAASAQVASISTSLLGRVVSRQVNVGSSIFVKVATGWSVRTCRLKAGDTLEARVVAVEHRGPGVKRETIALRFLPLPCAVAAAGQAQPVEVQPILVALEAAPTKQGDGALNREAFVGAFGSMVGTQHSGGQTAPPSGGMVMPGMGTNSGGLGGTPVEQPLRTAEVRGIAGVKLSLPTLTSDPTGLSSSHEMLFVPGTRFLLAVRLIAVEPAASAPTAPEAPPTATALVTSGIPAASAKINLPAPEPEEPADVPACVAGGCALADSPPLRNGQAAERQFSLRSLGYRTRDTRVLRSLVDDAAIRFLGQDQLLIAFDAHPLVPRSNEDAVHGNDLRIVRALLVSASSGKVLRAQDWRIESEGPYLWPLANGSVLAHVGGSLTVYGPGLRIERRWAIPGRLAWLRISPSRKLLVAAVIRERHTLEQHRRLAEFLGPGLPVEEDYDLTMLDDRLNVAGIKRIDALPEQAQVLDSGMLFSEPGNRERWNVFELDWNGQRRGITRVHSSCPLRLQTLPTNLILLVGCSSDGSHAWYSVLRSNGQTLLDGVSTGNDWLGDAEAVTAGSVFAIGIVNATRPIDFVAGTPASDFQKLAVSVYDASSGRRLFATKSTGEAANRQSFALNESGDRLAILSGENVLLYQTGETRLPSAAVGGEK